MAKRMKGPAGPTPVDSIKHKDTRKNIPTEELRDFVAAEEAAPPKILYPRDPSLDPQLVWKGKGEQDQHPLEVPVVPIYIQEKVHPYFTGADEPYEKLKRAARRSMKPRGRVSTAPSAARLPCRTRARSPSK
jgi:adenine-specific DNA-methyltransferase